MLLKFTPRALKHIQQSLPNDKVLKLSIIRKGCSGHMYNIQHIPRNEVHPKDDIINKNIYLDYKSILGFIGSTVDYEENELQNGLKISNPNLKDSCGCGQSFLL
eukprot:NODE_90_length_21806_cov_0.389137.p14 type:complete len:104 gc:universal NODE_90_length_21806_cov_0.389137:17870-17559(-)